MPFSSPLGKEKTIEYITNNFPTDAKILDIGCGNGTYFHLLSKLGYKLDGVEVYQPNVEKFGLRSKYKKLFEMDAKDVPSDTHYDLVIFGDVLEHFTPADAKEVIKYYKTFCSVILVSVPYKMGQGAYEGNTYEIHHQPDLDDDIFHERYPEFLNLIVEKNSTETIGVWVFDNRPTVMINILLKNSVPYFDQMIKQVIGLKYPKDKISLVFLENDSEDDTLEMIRNYVKSENVKQYKRVVLDSIKMNFKLLPSERHIAEKQVKRLSVLKKIRNKINHEFYDDEDYVWNIDHDFCFIDEWVLNKIVSFDKDVMMIPVYLPDGSIYDLGTVRFTPEGEYIYFNKIISENKDKELIQMDACSAACIFKGKFIEQGLDYESNDELEQEGFSFSASIKSLGATIWLLAKEKIIHQEINGTIGRG